MDMPKYHELFDSTLRALHSLGGSASIAELLGQVIELEEFPPEVVEPLHSGKPGKTELAYQLDWTRTYLKKYGLLENSIRGIWSLTAEGSEITAVDSSKVVRFVRERSRREREAKVEDVEIIEEAESVDNSDVTSSWQDVLMESLLSMKPDAFERLCQRILRESGFTQVEVTGRTGDGGIDGNGVIQLAGLLSFPVVFQCKRYRDNSISAGTVRDFRGAMVGRADKGLIMTTSSFTSSARSEATRDGAPPIDLLDGEKLMERLKELSIGVHTRQVELVEVDKEWFDNI